MRLFFLFLLTINLANMALAQVNSNPFLKNLLHEKASPDLKKVLNDPNTYHFQILYTKIDRNAKNEPNFTHYGYNVDKEQYFNPASTVKMPLAFLALEKINRLKIEGLDKYTPLKIGTSLPVQTPVVEDTSAANGLPSIAHYIKKIFLVSDNDAYNRLYEFLGQEYLNKRLWEMGYKDMRITRRFVTMTEEENRHTNPFTFYNGEKIIYEQPAAYSKVEFDFSKKLLVGNAHYDRNENYIEAPFDFTTHNAFPLEHAHEMLRSVLFPESVPADKRFELTDEDYQFLYLYMSKLPSESKFPSYDTHYFFDTYTKFFMNKNLEIKIPEAIRVFNKTGWSYGFLTDISYIIDTKNKVEYLISANIYVNSDGILNDDKYDYKEIGYPFFKEVNEIIYQYELERTRTHIPNLSKFIFSYE